MAFRWRADGGPFGLLGIGILRNSGTYPFSPLLKNKYKIKLQNFGPGRSEETRWIRASLLQ